MTQWIMFVCLLLPMMVVGQTVTSSQEKSSFPEKPNTKVQDEKKKAKRRLLKVLVLDPEGSPIEGVAITLSSMVMTSNSGKSYAWIDDQPELVQDLVTDANGQVTISFMKHPFDVETVARIRVSGKHSSFVEFGQWYSVDDGPIKLELKRGCQVAAMAVDALTQKSVKRNLYASSSRYELVDWNLKSNGTLVSPVFLEDEKTFRLVQIVEGKAQSFSDLIAVDPALPGKRLIRDIKLHPAVSIHGKLHSDVPRPVRNGLVIACVAAPNPKELLVKHRAWNWTVCAKIAADGSFEVEGIPANSVVQIAALCNGWTNQPSSDQVLEQHFPAYNKAGRQIYALPQIVEVDHSAQEFILPMQPTGSCQIRIVDESGQGISKARLSLSTFQLFFYFPSGPGFEYARQTALTLQRNRQSPSASDIDDSGSAVFKNLLTEFETNSEGILSVDNLPIGSGRGYVWHSDFPAKKGSSENDFRFKILSGENTEITRTMQIEE